MERCVFEAIVEGKIEAKQHKIVQLVQYSPQNQDFPWVLSDRVTAVQAKPGPGCSLPDGTASSLRSGMLLKISGWTVKFKPSDGKDGRLPVEIGLEIKGTVLVLSTEPFAVMGNPQDVMCSVDVRRGLESAGHGVFNSSGGQSSTGDEQDQNGGHNASNDDNEEAADEADKPDSQPITQQEEMESSSGKRESQLDQTNNARKLPQTVDNHDGDKEKTKTTTTAVTTTKKKSGLMDAKLGDPTICDATDILAAWSLAKDENYKNSNNSNNQNNNNDDNNSVSKSERNPERKGDSNRGSGTNKEPTEIPVAKGNKEPTQQRKVGNPSALNMTDLSHILLLAQQQVDRNETTIVPNTAQPDAPMEEGEQQESVKTDGRSDETEPILKINAPKGSKEIVNLDSVEGSVAMSIVSLRAPPTSPVFVPLVHGKNSDSERKSPDDLARESGSTLATLLNVASEVRKEHENDMNDQEAKKDEQKADAENDDDRVEEVEMVVADSKDREQEQQNDDDDKEEKEEEEEQQQGPQPQSQSQLQEEDQETTALGISNMLEDEEEAIDETINKTNEDENTKEDKTNKSDADDEIPAEQDTEDDQMLTEQDDEGKGSTSTETQNPTEPKPSTTEVESETESFTIDAETAGKNTTNKTNKRERPDGSIRPQHKCSADTPYVERFQRVRKYLFGLWQQGNGDDEIVWL